MPYEIILVDNNSKEQPANEFLEVFPELHLITLKENVGFGRANNLGVQNAKGKYVLLLNSDTLVKENTIDETVEFMKQNADIDILGCRVLFDNNTDQKTVIKYEGENNFFLSLLYFIKRNSFFIETRLFFINLRQRIQEKKVQQSQHLSSSEKSNAAVMQANFYNGKRICSLLGVFVLLKKSVYIESKGFDPDFFMYYEEIEWFLNRLHKYNIVYYPHVSITHFHGGSDVNKKMNLQFYISSYLFWYKMGYAQFFFYFFYNLLEIPSRLLVRVIFKKPRPGKDIPHILKSMPYFFKIMRHRNKFGSRPNMLKLNYLRENGL